MGKWVNGNGWLKGYVDEPRAKANTPKTNFSNGVIFIRPKCPICGSKNVRCYKTDDTIRYYRCGCGNKFKAYEKE